VFDGLYGGLLLWLLLVKFVWFAYWWFCFGLTNTFGFGVFVTVWFDVIIVLLYPPPPFFVLFYFICFNSERCRASAFASLRVLFSGLFVMFVLELLYLVYLVAAFV